MLCIGTKGYAYNHAPLLQHAFCCADTAAAVVMLQEHAIVYIYIYNISIDWLVKFISHSLAN